MLRPLLLVVGLLSACQPYTDPLCRPCTPGGCGAGLRCAEARGGGSVCVPEQGTVAACALSVALDAGPIANEDAGLDASTDAGAEDAAVVKDAGGVDRCPPGEPTGLTWVYSPHADRCFTRTEVTAEQFVPCVTSTCTSEFNYQQNLGSFPECNLFSTVYEDHPMNCIEQAGAIDFCALVGGRVPTEDEWFQEASAGETRRYPWGEEPATCEYAVMDEGSGPGCNVGTTQVPCGHPLGHSASGLCDMAGNVWELTLAVEGQNVILRGGGLKSPAGFMQAVSRTTSPLGGNYGDVGFRCVRDPEPE